MLSKNILERLREGFKLIAVVLVFHILLGIVAVFLNGSFIFGATAPERYVMHYITGDETHITFSGAPVDVINDFCVGGCEGCPTYCYEKSTLKFYCNDTCGIYTRKGVKIVSELQYFRYVLKNSLLIEDCKFICYNRTIGDCGFEIKLDENTSMSYNIDDEMKQST
ncbi:MAG: hypothetical protein NTU61_01090 [Candidatus Altiarchaeota archaeon]|nr:hypothetical protein [Candidatus Altiarchaeota archaeon]